MRVIVIGGGLVGLAVAYGLCLAGTEVTVLDETDHALRASRANFGLIWTQTKGLTFRPYAALSRQAARDWRGYAEKLAQNAGLEGPEALGYEQAGGLKLLHSDAEAQTYIAMLRRQFDADMVEPNAYGVWDRQTVRSAIPGVGPSIVGAAYCRLDGAVSPLRFYRALATATTRLGVRHMPGMAVQSIARQDNFYRVEASGIVFTADRVICAAGLGNRTLATALGLEMPIVPIRGQILVTRRMGRMLTLPTHLVRQSAEGTVIIGDSKEQVGLDDGSSLAVMGDIAARAIQAFPRLADVPVARAWSGLRIMTPDGAPIYHAPARYPGLTFANVHSGVTLAPFHSGGLVDWVLGRTDLTTFSMERFHDQAA